MSQGLQCWNANGNIVVDIGDYNIRFMGTYNINVVSGTPRYTVQVPGMESIGWFGHYAPSSGIFNEWSVYCNDGSFTAIYLPGDPSFGGSTPFNIYKWV